MSDFKNFRKSNRITQKDAANYFGCTQGFISQVENGRRPVPAEFISKAKANGKWDTSMFGDGKISDSANNRMPANRVAVPRSDNMEFGDLLLAIRRHSEQLILHGEELKKQGERLDRMLDLVSRFENKAFALFSQSGGEKIPPPSSMELK